MRVAVLADPGGAGNFYFEDRQLPQPEKGWVLVKVKAFGLNRSELMTRKGYSPNVTFPRVLGIECVGEVEEDPSGKFSRGQKVAAFMGGMGRDYDGSYGEFALLPVGVIAPFESSLSWEILGALPEMFQTVYGSLHLSLKIQAGETLLVRGGTSSIGLLAAQMAKAFGLDVIATTRNKEKEQLLLRNGANTVIIDDGAIAKQILGVFQVDKVLELVGTSTLPDSLQLVVPGGSVCMTGMLSEQWSIPDFAPMDIIPATVNLTVYDSGQVRVEGKYFQAFVNDIENGKIVPAINRTFNLSDIAAAHQLMESNSGGGKIVVLT